MGNEKKPNAGHKNLKPAQKGEVRNPKGRPKGIPDRRSLFKKYLDVVYRDQHGLPRQSPFGMNDKNPLTVRDLIVVSMLNEAIKGNVSAAKEIFDTEFGSKPQVITGDPDKPLVFDHTGKVEIELTGQALIDELKKRGLPTSVFDK